NVISEITPNGVQKIFEYDDRNQLIRKVLPDDQYILSYNDNGTLVSVPNNSATIEYSYISILGEEYVSSAYVSGINTPTYSLNYSYNSAGKRTSMDSAYISLNYGLDSAYRTSSISNNFGQNFGFEYDETNKLIQITRPNSVNTYLS